MNREDLVDPRPPQRTDGDPVAARTVVWTPGVELRAGRLVLGGSPWVTTDLPPETRDFAARLHAAGEAGLQASTDTERAAARHLLERGIAHPATPVLRPVDDVEVVVPVYGDAAALRDCLDSLAKEDHPVTVVDDASPQPDADEIAAVVAEHGMRLVRHPHNLGPGGARNTGMAATQAPFVAFVDADVRVGGSWLSRLRPVLDDTRVGAVAPRVRPAVEGTSAIELYEETRSELDMGPTPSLVVHAAPVGWLPSAAVLVRRAAASDPPFDPGLRVGEDVDLFWRMDEAGWAVRYVPDVVVHHRVRTSWKDFVGRRAMYGGSAAGLESRHPGRLTPASPSLSGLAVLASVSTGHPVLAASVAGYEFARQRRLLGSDLPVTATAEVTARSLGTDVFWLGHLLRRDWWPVGWAVLALSGRSRLARGVAAAMMWEPARDHLLRPTRLDPVRSLAMRLLDDASYGSGVIRNAWRKRVPNVVTPRPRFPAWPRG